MGCSDGFQDKTPAFRRTRMAGQPNQRTPSPLLRFLGTTYKQVRDRKADSEEELKRALDTKAYLEAPAHKEMLKEGGPVDQADEAGNYDAYWATSVQLEDGLIAATNRILELQKSIGKDTAEMEQLSDMLDTRCRWENIERSSLGLDGPSS